MWGLTRRVMDSVLLQAAAERGVRVIQPARVESVVTSPTGVRIAARLEDNSTGTFDCDYAVVADGKSALFGAKPLATSDLGVKAHFRQVRADRGTIYLFSLDGHYGGLAAVEEGLWNVALSVPQERVKRSGGDLGSVWREAVGYNPFLRTAFAQAEQVGEWLASPLPRFAVRTDWPERVVPVGNAAAALEPIGGEGMGLAMRSGELAAAAILRASRADAPLDVLGLQAAYRRLWRSRRPACRTVAVAMSMPRVAEAVVPLSRVAESATRAVLGLMGKSADR
jgi:2-polyprenyl-6-methoxyphenol hydroxylase-like FAD-dependent oxidoreductase